MSFRLQRSENSISEEKPKGSSFFKGIWLFALLAAAFLIGFSFQRGCQADRKTSFDSKQNENADLIQADSSEPGQNPSKVDDSGTFIPRIPARQLFASPFRKDYKISPDGEWVSFLELAGNRFDLSVQRLGSEKTQRLTEFYSQEPQSYFWANDERLVFMTDPIGDENWQMHGVSKYGGSVVKLTPDQGERAYLIDALENEPQIILVGMNARDAKVFDMYRLDVYSGRKEMIEQNPGGVTRWLTDHQGVLRVSLGNGMRYRENANSEWKDFPTSSAANQSSPLFFTPDNEDLYVASNFQRDKMAIYILDTDTGNLQNLVFEHRNFDVYSMEYSRKSKRPTRITVEAEKPIAYVLDERHQTLRERIRQKLSITDFEIYDSSRDENRMLIKTKSDLNHGKCYLFDVQRDEATLLFDYSPWLKSKYMANMEPIKYETSDGITIHGYLTLPKGSAGVNLPTIIYPHGGPWTRDVWRYDPAVQFFANRGYAVLQMNFRGSAGFGKAFLQAGYKQWGFAMQDDITDGVLWLIEEGITDPDRIAIYGSSYGGYAALAGLAFTPDLYQAGVMVSGISNLLTLLEEAPPYWEPFKNSMYSRIGHPIDDYELLKAASPIFHADKIEAPLLVAHGRNDVRTRYEQGAEMVNVLRTRSAEVEFIQFEAEGHSFKSMESLAAFYDALEKFLEEHL